MRKIIVAAACAAMCLAGCKTQQRVISREVFITTQSSGGGNYQTTTGTITPRTQIR